MNTFDPQIIQVLAVAFSASAMIVMGLKKRMLEARRPERCAACGRLLEAGRRCRNCG
jgi:hypothetical protein